ncbi:MAG TPA: exonuclease domain-containing protein [Burkholderiales bacterium]|nr:exonuclease domain-containing protein [Burkholderiales bacterium]
MLHLAPLAIVDVETTGTRPGFDRVTEIAVIEVEGFEVTSSWSTLVNPGTPIPAEIQVLTGITRDMVAGAPRFADLAQELHARLAGRVFIAHNARFDYGFLRREFQRAGLRFNARTLCSVRLSRRLYPGKGHDLDSVIARHGIDCKARHRALGDAEALWDFLRVASSEHGAEVFDLAARLAARQPSLPPQLDPAVLEDVPDAAGVYLFYGEGGAPLYVGKSRSLRSRVQQHFYSLSPWTRGIHRIEWRRTTGELGALLLESRLVKELSPAHNRQLRKSDAVAGFAFDGRKLRLAKADEIDVQTLDCLYGPFRSRAAARAALRALADEHRLCLRVLGFDTGGAGACFRHQIGRCAGVCAGRESIHTHHARLGAALAALRNAHWPHRGPLGVVETDPARDATEIHVVDRWCYLGAARDDGELAELLEARREPVFDYDHYRIFASHLAKRGVRVVELGH